MGDDPYPAAGWWAEKGEHLDGELTASWWAANSSYGHSRSHATGVGVALGWALGLIDDPAHMTPTHRDDGSALSDRERQEYGDVLRKLAEPAGTGLSA